MSTTITHTAAIMTSEVPVATGDVLRATDTPAVLPPRDPTPPTTDEGGSSRRRSQSQSQSPSQSPSHRRTSSTASDMARAAGIDIEAVSMAEARKIMSEEHKILGFRPPHGSFAAEVQSVVSKHPEGKPGIDTVRLREIAREDALRILAERKTSTDASPVSPTTSAKVLQESSGAGAAGGEAKHVAAAAPAQARHAPVSPGIDLNAINATDARILMSHEHRALGFRPPPGSLAAEAQSAAARHPEGDGTRVDDNMLREVAMRDAERIKADREGGEAAAAVIGASPGCEQPEELSVRGPSAGERFLEGFAPGKSPVEMAILKEKSRDEAGSDGQGSGESQSLNGAS